jgi:hypothetical protein
MPNSSHWKRGQCSHGGSAAPFSLNPPSLPHLTSWSVVFHAAHSATRLHHRRHASSVSHSLPSLSTGKRAFIQDEAPDFIIGQHQAESDNGRPGKPFLIAQNIWPSLVMATTVRCRIQERCTERNTTRFRAAHLWNNTCRIIHSVASGSTVLHNNVGLNNEYHGAKFARFHSRWSLASSSSLLKTPSQSGAYYDSLLF